MEEIEFEKLQDYSPEKIAETLFTNNPKPPFSYQIIAEGETADFPYIFEILSIILMEGLEILTGDLSKAKLDEFSKDHLTCLLPWFKSLGFVLKVQDYTDEEKDQYSQYYCRIRIKNKEDAILFQIKPTEKNYHFFINGTSYEENEKKENLKDIYSILVLNNVVYKISFNFHYPEMDNMPKNIVL